jgi:hypothetical protein
MHFRKRAVKHQPTSSEAIPPRIARAFLKRVLPGQEGACVVSDLDEEYVERARSNRTTRIWYWGQILAVDTIRLGWLLR